MAIARVVSFDGVSKDRMDEMKRDMDAGERPEGVAATEFLVLHDPTTEKSLAILFEPRMTTQPAMRRSTPCLQRIRRGSARPSRSTTWLHA